MNATHDERWAAAQPQSVQTSVVPANERRHAEFFDVIAASLCINSPEDFCTWTGSSLQHIFPHGMLICGVGKLQLQNAEIQHYLTCNFSHEYLQQLQQAGGMGSSPVFLQWLKTRCPVLFELTNQHTPTAWLENFKRYDLRNMVAHGVADLNGQTASYFSFSQIPGCLTPRHAYLLEMLIPHLHMALVRALKGANQANPPTRHKRPGLTDRENEILQWMCAGKTNWEIAQQLNISENTVKNHVKNVLCKLHVNTQAQAMLKVLTPL